MHYATLCIQQIKRSTGFEHAAMTEVLEKVWEARANHTRAWPNIPWMEFVSTFEDIKNDRRNTDCAIKDLL